MSSNDRSSAIHAGNYYTSGTKRVVAKLASMGITVPRQALEIPPHTGPGQPWQEFTRLEHAMLDWFIGRDYDQAQALINYRQPRKDWYVIRVLDEDKCPREIGPNMLCPSLKDAIAAIICACDSDSVGIDAFRHEEGGVAVIIEGTVVAQLGPITYEPFDVDVRDRVRTAFKGVRRYHTSMLRSRVARLPGYDMFRDVVPQADDERADACLLLGFPANWAFAMRSALKQVGISVKQSQAQELAAVFFGASDWHQLIRHQHELDPSTMPVALTYQGPGGAVERFYHTSEEAIFAIGDALRQVQDPVFLDRFDLGSMTYQVFIQFITHADFEKRRLEFMYLPEPVIHCGYNDYWSIADNADETFGDAALRVLATLMQGDGTALGRGVLYQENNAQGVLEASLAREGLPGDHLVYLGDYAVGVFHVPDPDGLGMLAAKASFFCIADNHVKQLGTVSMYKAVVTVEPVEEECRVEIRGDYGNHDPIVLSPVPIHQVRRFLRLCYTNGLFSHEVPDIQVNALKNWNQGDDA